MERSNEIELNSIDILGTRLDIVNWSQVIEHCKTFLKSSANHITTLNGEIALNAHQNPELQQAINNSALVIADSANIVWAARIKGVKHPSRTPGVDLVDKLCQLAAAEGASVFFLGGWGDVASVAAQKLAQRYPRLIIAGTSNANPDNENIIDEIKQSQAKIVFVAYGGSAKQEIWINKNKVATGASILVGIGGAFDMISGRIPRAPKLVRALSLEWLWRLINQPTRIGRIWKALVVFPFRVLIS